MRRKWRAWRVRHSEVGGGPERSVLGNGRLKGILVKGTADSGDVSVTYILGPGAQVPPVELNRKPPRHKLLDSIDRSKVVLDYIKNIEA